MQRADFTLAYPLRVRWAEVDMQGVVFNPHYLMYFDTAIAEYWRAIGFDYPQGIVALGSDIFVVKSTVEYHASARYDDELEVCCRVGRIGRTSMQFLFGIWRGAQHLISGELIYVNANLETHKSTPWPPALTRAVMAYERTAPAQPE